jgi:hypothetical protein
VCSSDLKCTHIWVIRRTSIEIHKIRSQISL